MTVPACPCPPVCPRCNEVILSATVLRRDTSSKPTEQQIYPQFCPVCGAELNHTVWNRTPMR